MKSEHQIQNEIQIKLSQNNCVVFRGNVGKVKMANGRWFDTGLPKGFSDLFGYRKWDGRIFFIEVKKPGGNIRAEQKIFLRAMRNNGCIAGIAYSAEEALNLVKE